VEDHKLPPEGGHVEQYRFWDFAMDLSKLTTSIICEHLSLSRGTFF